MALEQEPDPLRRIPTKHTADMKAEIGSVLRAARLKRGQSLEAVAQQTRISKRFLEALENDRFEQFPAIVYLRGFLKGYCEHLEVDFDEIWAKFEATQTEAAPGAVAPSPQPPAPAPAPKQAFTPAGRASLHSHPTPPPAAAGATKPEAPHGRAPSPSPAHSATADHHAGGASGATPALVLAAVLGLALAVWLYKDNAKSSQAPSNTSPVALQPLPRAIEPKLVIRLKSDAWLRVTVDGQMVFEGRAPRGASQEWKPAKSVGLRTTEPAALELELNGAPAALGAPGADGEYRVEIP